MKISYGQCSAQAIQIKYHLHGESHEDGTHHPSSIVPLPDDVLVGLLPPQAGAGQVHLINLQILLQLWVGFSFVFSFLVGPIILVAWKPKKVSEETNFSFLTCNYPALPSLPVWVWVTDTESLSFIYRKFELHLQKVWVTFTESLSYIYKMFELHFQKVWGIRNLCIVIAWEIRVVTIPNVLHLPLLPHQISHFLKWLIRKLLHWRFCKCFRFLGDLFILSIVNTLWANQMEYKGDCCENSYHFQLVCVQPSSSS